MIGPYGALFFRDGNLQFHDPFSDDIPEIISFAWSIQVSTLQKIFPGRFPTFLGSQGMLGTLCTNMISIDVEVRSFVDFVSL